MQSKFISLLSIARKAGRLKFGKDAVQENLLNGRAQLVLLASDISSRSANDVKKICAEHNATILELKESMDALYLGVGKRSGIVCVNDEGFAQKLKLLFEESKQEECSL